MGDEKITQEELKAIVDAAAKRNLAKTAAETALTKAQTAALQAQNAELQHQVTVQHVFMKYGLTFNDQVDDVTGVINRGANKAEKIVKPTEATEAATEDVTE